MRSRATRRWNGPGKKRSPRGEHDRLDVRSSREVAGLGEGDVGVVALMLGACRRDGRGHVVQEVGREIEGLGVYARPGAATRSASQPVLAHQFPGVSPGAGFIASTRSGLRPEPARRRPKAPSAVKAPIDCATSTTSSRRSAADTTRST